MHLSVILRISGILLMLFSTASLPSVVVAWWYGEAEIILFIYTFLITLVTGLIFFLLFRQARHRPWFSGWFSDYRVVLDRTGGFRCCPVLVDGCAVTVCYRRFFLSPYQV